MDIKSKIKPSAKIELRIGLTSNGIRNIRIVADSVESRDWAMLQVIKLRPGIELIESMLAPLVSSEAPSASADNKS